MPTTLAELNLASVGDFVAVVGPAFEHSAWIAERTAAARPFGSRAELHEALCATLRSASPEEQLALICAHPDLVGRAAIDGTLTPESRGEQASAGLGDLSPEEITLFQRYNAAYRARFGFPFVICARQNKQAAILTAFPPRLANTREAEIATALAEIEQIARLRLDDAVSED